MIRAEVAAELAALIAEVVPTGDWVEEALCAQTDPELFFPEKGGSTRDAKSICRKCPVAAECLEFALDNHERYGIWGNTSEQQRRTLRPARMCVDCRAEPASSHSPRCWECAHKRKQATDAAWQRTHKRTA